MASIFKQAWRIVELFRREPKQVRQFDEDALKKAQAAVRQEEAAKRLSGEKLQVAAEGRQDMSDEESETRNQKSEKEQEQERPLGPTEELLAEDQAEAIVEGQKAEKASGWVEEMIQEEEEARRTAEQNPQQPSQEAGQERTAEQEQKASDKEQEKDQLEEARQGEQESLNPHTQGTGFMTPEREEQERAAGMEPGTGGMGRSPGTKVRLEAVVTMSGVYVVPRHVEKEPPARNKERSQQSAQDRENDRGRQQARAQERVREQVRERDDDRDLER